METSRSIPRSVHAEDGMCSFDPKVSYLQVPLHPYIDPISCFSWERVGLFRVFTLFSPRPFYIFTHIMAPILVFLLLLGIQILRFLDGYLILASSRTKESGHQTYILSFLFCLLEFSSHESSLLFRLTVRLTFIQVWFEIGFNCPFLIWALF